MVVIVVVELVAIVVEPVVSGGAGSSRTSSW